MSSGGVPVTGFGELARRAALPDAHQHLAYYFVCLLFAIVATWPSSSGAANDSWFTVAHTRGAALGLLGLGYGVYASGRKATQRSALAVILALFALVALPLEVTTYAASYPDVPLWWIVALPVPTALGMYSLGILFGGLLRIVRLLALAPVATPVLLIGLLVADSALGVDLFNPVTAAVRVEWEHAAFLGALAALLPLLLRGPAEDRA